MRQNIEARTKSMGMEGKIHEIAIPMEEVTEFKAGKKVIAKKKMFPGYLLIRCSLDDDSWYVIRNTPGVTGFVGAGNKPSPLSRKDVENFIATPWGPSAVPTGGAGEAWPAGIWILTSAVTFFLAIDLLRVLSA